MNLTQTNSRITQLEFQQSALVHALREMLEEFHDGVCTVPDQRRARRLATEALRGLMPPAQEEQELADSDVPSPK